MNNETLKKAEELSTEIDKLHTAIYDISYHRLNAKKHRPSVKYDWMLRVFNKKINAETKEPRVFLFDNDDTHGSDIPINEELLIIIKGYFESKLKEKEQQFNELT